MRYDAGFRWGMGRSTLKIVLSLAGAAAAGCLVFLLLEAALSSGHPSSPGAVLFRFQLSSMIAMATFGGIAIILYVRLSRGARNAESQHWQAGRDRPRKR